VPTETTSPPTTNLPRSGPSTTSTLSVDTTCSPVRGDSWVSRSLMTAGFIAVGRTRQRRRQLSTARGHPPWHMAPRLLRRLLERERTGDRAAGLGLGELRGLHDASDAVAQAGIRRVPHRDVGDAPVGVDLHRHLDLALGGELLTARHGPRLHLVDAVGDDVAIDGVGQVAALVRGRAAARRCGLAAPALAELGAARALVAVEHARHLVAVAATTALVRLGGWRVPGRRWRRRGGLVGLGRR